MEKRYDGFLFPISVRIVNKEEPEREQWLELPTTPQALRELLQNIGGDRQGWYLGEVNCHLYNAAAVEDCTDINELNYLAAALEALTDGEFGSYQAIVDTGRHCDTIQDMINLTENLDCYEVNPNITDYDDLGRYYIDELEAMQIPDCLQNYIDYEAYGRDVALDEDGQFTDYGYVRDTRNSFIEAYDGNPENIPEEYRVMSVPEEDLSKEEIEALAADIAHDLDALFRQKDSRYAAAFPTPQNAWPDIQEKLLAGRIADYSEKLETLGQKATDYLPSELEKFKEATGNTPSAYRRLQQGLPARRLNRQQKDKDESKTSIAETPPKK